MNNATITFHPQFIDSVTISHADFEFVGSYDLETYYINGVGIQSDYDENTEAWLENILIDIGANALRNKQLIESRK